jgi:hypothetical protein
MRGWRFRDVKTLFKFTQKISNTLTEILIPLMLQLLEEFSLVSEKLWK